MTAKKVAVIGGGLAGLSGAIHLQKNGFDVDIYEQNDQLGGKTGEYRWNGFRWDTGPSLITLPFVIEELFETAGEKREKALPWIAVDPLCRYFWTEGARLDAAANFSRLQNEIESFSPGQGDATNRFLAYSKRIWDITADLFLTAPIHELKTWLNLKTLRRLFLLHQIDPLHTVDQGVRRFFKDPRLIQLFDRYATYNGSDPFQAPATLNIIPYVECVLGGYYLHGGIYRLVEELQRLADNLGVRIHTRHKVDKIHHQNGVVTGIQVDDHRLPVDAVLCNADVVQSFRSLIDGFPAEQKKLERLEPSLSGIVFLWAVNRKHEGLAHHNIFFSNDYRREFVQIFAENRVPDDPTVYVAITSKTDPMDAPPGQENWFVLVNAPYLQNQEPQKETLTTVRQNVLNRLLQNGFDARKQIVHEHVISPQDFFLRYGSNRGSIYGISSNSRKTAFQRPANRSRRIRGLYFAGGSVHPGGGIPLVLLSGKLAAGLIVRYQGD
ncbi:phytoene desaturase [candidate division KSB1 bacterium]|nr:phytoene desaturase [candidate division KSB1 bacterium]